MNALIVITSPTGLPVQAKPQLKQLAERLDALPIFYDEMSEALQALHGAPCDKAKLVASAKSWLLAYRKSPIRKALLNGDLLKINKALLVSLPEEAWWGDDDKVKQSAVVRAVGMLLSSFTQAVANAEIFTAQMIEDVHELQPHPFAVEEAWRDLRHTKKFTPAISEVRAAYEAALQMDDPLGRGRIRRGRQRAVGNADHADGGEGAGACGGEDAAKLAAFDAMLDIEHHRRLIADDAKQHPEAVEAAR